MNKEEGGNYSPGKGAAKLTHEQHGWSEVRNGIFLPGGACQLAKEHGRLEKYAVELWGEKEEGTLQKKIF